MQITGPDEYLFETLNVFSLNTQLFPLPTVTNGDFVLTGRFFFPVPADCEKFSITVRGGRDGENRSVIEIVTPEDRIVRHVSLTPTAPDQVIEIIPAPESRGKVWSLAASMCPIVKVEGIPSWFAATVAGAQTGLNTPKEKRTAAR